MEDDDEFGDLYTDVLRPIPATTLQPSAAPSMPPTKLSPDPSLDDGSPIRSGSSPMVFRAPPPSSLLAQSLDSAPEGAGDDDWMLGEVPAAVDEPENWDDEEDPFRPSGQPRKDFARDFGPVGLDEEEDSGTRVSDSPKKVGDDAEVGGDIDQDPVIPGLSAGPSTIGSFPNGTNARSSRIDNWDSDSEDDLQIVLNENEHGPLGGEIGRGMGVGDEDDEDGEEDLVIVTDEDQLHHAHLEGVDEQEWAEDGAQMAADGERKEAADGKGSGSAGSLAGTRIGYSNHGFHAQHYSMFKVSYFDKSRLECQSCNFGNCNPGNCIAGGFA